MEKTQILGVFGAGQMGQGITQTAASFGFSVHCLDSSLKMLEKTQAQIKKNLTHLVNKQKITQEEMAQTIERILYVHFSSTFDKPFFKNYQVVIEAIKEDVQAKLELFAQLDSLLPPESILCSNTSSFSITRLASATKRPDRVVGMHFMNPVPVMQLVEGIRGLQTSDVTFLQVKALAEKMGKVFVESTKDSPGFIVNRILMPMINEAFFALDEGIASARDIDTAMKLGCRHPMGPLELADFIGLDVCLAIMQILHKDLGDSKYRPSPLLIKYVEAGWLGRKTSKGVFNYAISHSK